jgi:DNA-binding NarL/FixJ family response regulator
MPNQAKVRLLIADDHEMIHHGVRALLAGTEIEVTATATTGQAAIKRALEKDVDVVLVDVRMPDGDGLMALSHIKADKPDLPVLLFSAFDNSALLAQGIAMGANGFVPKTCTKEELVQTVRTVVAGEDAWPDKALRSGRGSLRTPRLEGNIEVALSQREGEVLRKTALGLTNKQIAEELDIDYTTVQLYIHQLLRKIGLVDRTQAALWAVRNGLV